MVNLGQNHQSAARVTLKFNGWPWKTIGHLFYTTSSFVYRYVAICEFKLELWSRNAQIGAKFVVTSVTLTTDLFPWPFAWTSLLSLVIIPENFMMEHREKGVTDGQTDWTIHRAAWSQLKTNILSWKSQMTIVIISFSYIVMLMPNK